MQRTIILITFLQLSIFSCKNYEQKSDSFLLKNETIITNENEIDWIVADLFTETWKPNTKDLNQARELMGVAAENGDFYFLKEPVIIEINEYYLQYIPYLSENGEKILLVNAFCEVIPNPVPDVQKKSAVKWENYNWKSEVALVMDSGMCYWQLTLNLTKNDFSNVRVNGRA